MLDNKPNMSVQKGAFGALSVQEKVRLVSSVAAALSCVLILLILIYGVTMLSGTIKEMNTTFKAINESEAILTEGGEMITRLNAISKELEAADMPGLISDLQSLSAEARTTLGKLDEAAMETLESSSDALKKLADIDIEGLNRSIGNFSAIIEPLSRLFGR